MKTPLILDNCNVNGSVRTYLSPTPVGISLIWAVHQTLPVRVRLHETNIFKGGHVFERLQYGTVTV